MEKYMNIQQLMGGIMVIWWVALKFKDSHQITFNSAEEVVEEPICYI